MITSVQVNQNRRMMFFYFLFVNLCWWVIGVVLNYISREHFLYVPSQWDTTLQCNVVSHWVAAFTERSLYQEYSNASILVINSVFATYVKGWFPTAQYVLHSMAIGQQCHIECYIVTTSRYLYQEICLGNTFCCCYIVGPTINLKVLVSNTSIHGIRGWKYYWWY